MSDGPNNPLSWVLGYYKYLLQGRVQYKVILFSSPLSIYNQQGKALPFFFLNKSQGKHGQRCCPLFCFCLPSHSSAQCLGQLPSPDALCSVMLPASAEPPTVWFTGSCLSFSIHPLWELCIIGTLYLYLSHCVDQARPEPLWEPFKYLLSHLRP